MKKSIILINRISEKPSPDELDVLYQAAEVEKAMKYCGYTTKKVYFDLNLSAVQQSLEEFSPDLVFNLVESVGGQGELIHLAPSILESMNIPFTGAGSYAMYISSHKMLAKEHFIDLEVPTATWLDEKSFNQLRADKIYIRKPVWEDGSLGITDNSIISGVNLQLTELNGLLSKKEFLEEYIPGREFNLSILGGAGGPVVLPPAEIRFVDYPPEKPHILNYASKWDENSFEYQNSIRSFKFEKSDSYLLEELKRISLKCWNGFSLKGYARVDFRVNLNNEPFVLEVNANPCISPDAGFIAAANKAGLNYNDVVDRIIFDAINK